MKQRNLKQRLGLEIEKTKRNLSNRRFRGVLLPFLSLLAIIIAGLYLYIQIGRPVSLDYPYPVFNIDEPIGERVPTSDDRILTISSDSAIINFRGSFNNSGMPDWGASTIRIFAEIDDENFDEMSISSSQQSFDFPLDFSSLSSGTHSLILYATHNTDWRTWKSTPIIYEITLKSTQLSQLIITSLSKIIEPDTYLITGYTEPFSSILINGANIVTDENLPGSDTRADYDGYFWVNIQPSSLENIEVFATSQDGTQSSTPFILATSDLNTFANDHPQPITDIKLNLGANHIDKEFTIYLSAKDPALAKLLTDKSNLRGFLNTTTGILTINQSNFDWYLNKTTPNVTIKDGKAIVSLKLDNYASGILDPIGSSNIILSNRIPIKYRNIHFVRNVQITISDYSVVSLSPTPDSINGNTYIWTNFSDTPQINLVLQQSITQWLTSLPRWSVYDFVGENYIVGDGLSLILSFISALPIFVLIWLTSIYISDKKEWKVVKQTIISILLSAITFLIIPALWSLINTIMFSSFNDDLSKFELYNFFEYIYRTLLPGYFYSSQEIFISYVSLIGIMVLSLYIIWFTKEMIPFIGTVFRVLLRASIIIFTVSYIMSHISSFSGYPDADVSISYPIWITSGLVLYFVGGELVIRVSELINQHRTQLSPSIIQARFWGMVSVFILAVIVAYVIGKTPLEFRDDISQLLVLYDSFSALSDGAMLFSSFGAAMLVVFLSRSKAWKEENDVFTNKDKIILLKDNDVTGREKFWFLLGMVFFVGYIVGIRDLVLSFPLSALIAMLIYRYIFISQEKIAKINFLFDRIHDNRSKLLAQLANELSATKLHAKLNQLLINLSSGKITPTEYDASEAIIRKEIDQLEKEKLISDIPSKDFVLTVGPERDAIENAFLGSKWAFLLQFPLMFLLFNAYISENVYSPWVNLLVSIFNFVFRWIIIGFTFGLFYEKIRGNNGLRKALTLTLAIIVAYLPYRLILSSWSTTSLQSFVLQMGFTAVFLLGLGLLFDWETLKRHGYGISYMQVVFSDMPSMVYASSFLITTLTVVITTVLSGQLTQVLTTIVNGLLPVIINNPPLR